MLNNMKSWYFGYENVRPADHIDALWSVFAAGLRYAQLQTMPRRGMNFLQHSTMPMGVVA